MMIQDDHLPVATATDALCLRVKLFLGAFTPNAAPASLRSETHSFELLLRSTKVLRCAEQSTGGAQQLLSDWAAIKSQLKCIELELQCAVTESTAKRERIYTIL
ncbi:hypothetical protein ILYODFUR_002697 [Ilyodon furcidens]|uniref:Uncharacterized protein n=1 Tax=Ilyodon furcidens TaxID=33524 RepID=A0ABV0VC89_9TELE